jgi:hypothetical protein
MLPPLYTHARERTLADMLRESRVPPSGLPTDFKALLSKLADATERPYKPAVIGHVSSEILLPTEYAAANKSTRANVGRGTARARPRHHSDRPAGEVSAPT